MVGRSSLKNSAKLVEHALKLGIRYFDVAPSYGAGTAEEVIGKVIGDSSEIVIATKCGIPRPRYNPIRQSIRRIIKPTLEQVSLVKRLLLKMTSTTIPPAESKDRHDYSLERIRQSLEESLHILNRSRADVFLAHEPTRDALTPEIAKGFRELTRLHLATCFGAGVGMTSDRFSDFGHVWQSCWPGGIATNYSCDTTHVFHGALRYCYHPRTKSNDLGKLMASFSMVSPNSVLIISAATTERLDEVVNAALHLNWE